MVPYDKGERHLILNRRRYVVETYMREANIPQNEPQNAIININVLAFDCRPQR